MFREYASEESSARVDWAQLLLSLDGGEQDLRIIGASREKIAHEIIRLRAENQKLQ